MKKNCSSSPSLDFERPLTTVDVAIFSVLDASLKVLLVRRPADSNDPFPGLFALPGGFIDIKKDRSLEDCAMRKLKEKTGVTTPYLEQLGSWGGAKRDPRGWSATHAYFALIPQSLRTSSNAEQEGLANPEWLSVDEASRKRLAFDHAQILHMAITRLKNKVEYTSLPAYLLAEPFTLPQLQQMYEVVLERPMDKSAFRKRMLDAEFLEETGMIDGGSGRPAMGYRIRERNQAMTFPRTFKAKE